MQLHGPAVPDEVAGQPARQLSEVKLACPVLMRVEQMHELGHPALLGIPGHWAANG